MVKNEAVDLAFGRRVQALRVARGWSSREQLADALQEKLESNKNMYGTVRRIEEGRYPQVRTQMALADIFGITLDQLMGRAPLELTAATGPYHSHAA